MNPLANLIVGVIAAGQIVAGALAADEFTIEVYTGQFDQSGEIVNGSESLHGSWQWDASTQIVFDGATLPAIDDSPTFTRINIYGSSNDDLGFVHIPGQGTNNVHVLIGLETATRADTAQPAEALVQNMAGFFAGSNVRLKMSMAGNIMANIVCNDIRRIDVGGSHRFGQVKANIRGPEFMIVAGDVESAASFSPHILATGSTGIDQIRIEGDLDGKVETTISDLTGR